MLSELLALVFFSSLSLSLSLVLSVSVRRFRVLEMVGGGGKWLSTLVRLRGGGAIGIPLSSSVRSALNVVRLANRFKKKKTLLTS